MRKTEKPDTQRAMRIAKWMEWVGSLGLLCVAAALLAPLFNLTDISPLHIYKWIYAAGAVIFTATRVVEIMTHPKEEPSRLRRLRRMEFWAGAAFIAGAAIWFYQEEHLGPYAGALAVLRDTILLSMVGGAIQIIASWLIGTQLKKLSRREEGAE